MIALCRRSFCFPTARPMWSLHCSWIMFFLHILFCLVLCIFRFGGCQKKQTLRWTSESHNTPSGLEVRTPRAFSCLGRWGVCWFGCRFGSCENGQFFLATIPQFAQWGPFFSFFWGRVPIPLKLPPHNLLGLSMEDPTPPLDTPKCLGFSKPGCLRAQTALGASG